MYVTSYYRSNGYPTIQTRTVSAVFPSIYVGLSIGAFLGVPLSRIFGHKFVSFINMVVYSVSMFIATFVNFELFLVFQGFIPGFCIGVEYLIPVDNALHYYPPGKKVFLKNYKIFIGVNIRIDSLWTRIWITNI